MKAEYWPNNLGIDLLDDRNEEVAEVWFLNSAHWAIRTFVNGEPDRCMKFPRHVTILGVKTKLELNPEAMYRVACKEGEPVSWS